MYPPATEVVKVEYLANDDGLLHTLAASTYVADIAGNLRPTLGLAYGQTWPSLWPHPAPVHVTYKAGYPAGLCPRPLIEGIRMIAQDLYENREDKITVMIGERQVIPNQMMTRILAPYTLWEM